MKFRSIIKVSTYNVREMFPDIPNSGRYDAEIVGNLEVLWRIEMHTKADGLYSIDPWLYSVKGEVSLEYYSEEGDLMDAGDVSIDDILGTFRQEKPDFKIEFNPELKNGQMFLADIEIDFAKQTIEIT